MRLVKVLIELEQALRKKLGRVTRLKISVGAQSSDAVKTQPDEIAVSIYWRVPTNRPLLDCAGRVVDTRDDAINLFLLYEKIVLLWDDVRDLSCVTNSLCLITRFLTRFSEKNRTCETAVIAIYIG